MRPRHLVLLAIPAMKILKHQGNSQLKVTYFNYILGFWFYMHAVDVQISKNPLVKTLLL